MDTPSKKRGSTRRSTTMLATREAVSLWQLEAFMVLNKSVMKGDSFKNRNAKDKYIVVNSDGTLKKLKGTDPIVLGYYSRILYTKEQSLLPITQTEFNMADTTLITSYRDRVHRKGGLEGAKEIGIDENIRSNFAMAFKTAPPISETDIKYIHDRMKTFEVPEAELKTFTEEAVKIISTSKDQEVVDTEDIAGHDEEREEDVALQQQTEAVVEVEDEQEEEKVQRQEEIIEAAAAPSTPADPQLVPTGEPVIIVSSEKVPVDVPLEESTELSTSDDEITGAIQDLREYMASASEEARETMIELVQRLNELRTDPSQLSTIKDLVSELEVNEDIPEHSVLRSRIDLMAAASSEAGVGFEDILGEIQQLRDQLEDPEGLLSSQLTDLIIILGNSSVDRDVGAMRAQLENLLDPNSEIFTRVKEIFDKKPEFADLRGPGNVGGPGLKWNPIHTEALSIYFGNPTSPNWDNTLLQDRENRWKNIPMDQKVARALMENQKLVEKYGVELFVYGLKYTSGQDVIRENTELIQLFFAYKCCDGEKSQDLVKVPVSSLVAYRNSLADNRPQIINRQELVKGNKVQTTNRKAGNLYEDQLERLETAWLNRPFAHNIGPQYNKVEFPKREPQRIVRTDFNDGVAGVYEVPTIYTNKKTEGMLGFSKTEQPLVLNKRERSRNMFF